MSPLSFRYVSDLHLEFAFGTSLASYEDPLEKLDQVFADLALQSIPHLDTDPQTVLLLAGDICEAWRATTRYAGFFESLSKRFAEVLWVGGNHEYYGHKLSDSHNHRVSTAVTERWPNVKFCDRKRVDFTNWTQTVTVLATTLWTNFDKANPVAMMAAGDKMNDYRAITFADVDRDIFRTLRPLDTLGRHKVEWKWLTNEINKVIEEDSKRRIIVMTHHAPSYQSVPDRYLRSNDILNAAYASNLNFADFKRMPNMWIHGHLHDPVMYDMGECRVVSNPRGYMTELYNYEYDGYAGITYDQLDEIDVYEEDPL